MRREETRHSYFRILYRGEPLLYKCPSPYLSACIYSHMLCFSLDELCAHSWGQPFHLYTRFILSHLLMHITSISTHTPSFLLTCKHAMLSTIWKNYKWTKTLLTHIPQLSPYFSALLYHKDPSHPYVRIILFIVCSDFHVVNSYDNFQSLCDLTSVFHSVHHASCLDRLIVLELWTPHSLLDFLLHYWLFLFSPLWSLLLISPSLNIGVHWGPVLDFCFSLFPWWSHLFLFKTLLEFNWNKINICLKYTIFMSFDICICCKMITITI